MCLYGHNLYVFVCLYFQWYIMIINIVKKRRKNLDKPNFTYYKDFIGQTYTDVLGSAAFVWEIRHSWAIFNDVVFHMVHV